MDRTVNYADILTQVLREESKIEFRAIPRLKMVSSCDRESGQFLLIMIGWDNREHWTHNIIFHAQLIDGKVIIEADMTEGLKPLLLEAGIRAEDFLSDRDRDREEEARLAAWLPLHQRCLAMDQTVKYADILTQVLREEAMLQPSFQPGLKIVSSCDSAAGQFLLLVIGWDKKHPHHSILFHARLVDGKVIIETDMTEGLKPALIEAGIRAEDFLSDREDVREEVEQLAA